MGDQGHETLPPKERTTQKMIHLFHTLRSSTPRLLSKAAASSLFLPASSTTHFFSTTPVRRDEELVAAPSSSPANQCFVANHPTNDTATEADVFAVLKLSGSQYKVTVGDVLTVNKVPEAEVGKSLHIDDVLLVGTPNQTIVGAPLVPNARVTLEVEEQKKDKKVLVFKKKRRQGYQRKNGARRHITVLRVASIDY